MRRLISLFKEPQDAYLSPALSDAERAKALANADAPRAEGDEPIYFQELLAYLRQRNQQQRQRASQNRHEPHRN